MLVTEVSLNRSEGQPIATVNTATAICPAMVTTAARATPTVQRALEDQKVYYVKKLDSVLRVKVKRPSSNFNDVAHLVIIKSKIPQSMWKRLFAKETRNYRIRERQAMGDHAECFIIRA